MRVRLFTLRYSPTLGAFDDSPLLDFLRTQDLLAFREHFFLVQTVPHLLCVACYQDQAPACPAATPRKDRNGSDRPDPTAGLCESDRALFQTMRQWRAEAAEKEGVPRYVILTNAELLQIIQQKPEGRTALSQIPGIGRAKVERWGDAILQQLHGAARSLRAHDGS